MTEASQQANQKSQPFPSANEPPRSRKLGVNKPVGSALDGAASSERNRNCCGLANQHIIAASDLRSLYTNQHASAAAKTSSRNSIVIRPPRWLSGKAVAERCAAAPSSGDGSN
ncbi:hypothetical protein LSAT2_006584 [Lamellibrachia satsuma]|nr:hypothetical protein LSAT2_006584 [Lamellibrachia satsuma]